jgi:hypothetical protein
MLATLAHWQLPQPSQATLILNYLDNCKKYSTLVFCLQTNSKLKHIVTVGYIPSRLLLLERQKTFCTYEKHKYVLVTLFWQYMCLAVWRVLYHYKMYIPNVYAFEPITFEPIILFMSI